MLWQLTYIASQIDKVMSLIVICPEVSSVSEETILNRTLDTTESLNTQIQQINRRYNTSSEDSYEQM